MNAPLFPLGRLYITPGAADALRRSDQSCFPLLRRHSLGDWGDVCQNDAIQNTKSVARGWRILSVYSTKLGERLWIITEADRSVTTILLPEEY